MPLVFTFIVTVPFFLAVILPFVFTVAIFLFEEVNLAVPIFPAILRVNVLPFLTDTEFLLRVGLITFTVNTFLTPLLVTVILVVPLLTPVTTPFDVTFAIFVLLDL